MLEHAVHAESTSSCTYTRLCARIVWWNVYQQAAHLDTSLSQRACRSHRARLRRARCRLPGRAGVSSRLQPVGATHPKSAHNIMHVHVPDYRYMIMQIGLPKQVAPNSMWLVWPHVCRTRTPHQQYTMSCEHLACSSQRGGQASLQVSPRGAALHARRRGRRPRLQRRCTPASQPRAREFEPTASTAQR